MTDVRSAIALTRVPGVGSVLVRQLVSYCGSPEAVFRSPAAKLRKIPGIGEVTAQAIGRAGVQAEADTILATLDKMGAKALFYTDADFPERLKTIYDAPTLLYWQGNANLNTARTIGLVGTRQATDYGRKITAELVEGLSTYSPVILSGLAYGIDIAAHRACVALQVSTIGVMASGLDVIYPNVHKKTAADMLLQGGLLTESPPGTKPDAHLFPARNRIIAGLSDAVVVVEAAAKGGALITAEYANNYHREVFAVPGPLTQPFSAGCHRLIRDNKAQIYTSVQDIVEALNWDKPQTPTPAKPALSALPLDLTDDESQVLALLRQANDLHIDDLSWKTQIPMGRLASLLLNLEFKGFIRSLPGKRYGIV